MMKRALLLILLFPFVMSCGPDFSSSSLGDEITFEPDRPILSDNKTVAPYQGTDIYVVDAQERYRTGLDIQRKIIFRTCTPFDGVCHNKKEYPDLHTTANFLDAIEAPCNIQPGDFTSVFDRCEPVPDAVKLGDNTNAVAWLELIESIEGEEQMSTEQPGLHLHLRDPIDAPVGDTFYTRARFIRSVGGDDIAFASYEDEWTVLGPTHIVAQANDNRLNAAIELLEVGIQEGDQNRNGVFGNNEMGAVQMIVPGNPEESYLIARIRGEMNGNQIPGSRMPLANQPLDIADMLALFCYVEGIPTDGSKPDLRWPIDYNSCSYAADPEGLNLLGSGVTWTTRISKVFEANCGGCHFEGAPMETGAGLDLLSEGSYARMLEFSVQNPEMKLVEPGEPENSYLWLKLVGDDNIIGNPMPYNPLTGEGTLREAELGDVQTWIINGATENE